MIHLSELIAEYEDDLLARFRDKLLPSHLPSQMRPLAWTIKKWFTIFCLNLPGKR